SYVDECRMYGLDRAQDIRHGCSFCCRAIAQWGGLWPDAVFDRGRSDAGIWHYGYHEPRTWLFVYGGGLFGSTHPCQQWLYVGGCFGRGGSDHGGGLGTRKRGDALFVSP